MCKRNYADSKLLLVAGKIEEAGEFLLVIKTSRDVFDQLRVVLESAHSYELPEVIALPVVAGSPNYLAWLDSGLTAPDNTAPDNTAPDNMKRE
jgi:uncharacterized protein involved in tolerance to divalent cations